MTSLVEIGVTSHGNKTGVTVTVQPTAPPTSPWQFAKLAPVIVAREALTTLTLNVVEVQDAPEFSAAVENPKLAESSRPSVVPTGDQLAADATDGTKNAHNAITAPKSNMLFFITNFNIPTHSS